MPKRVGQVDFYPTSWPSDDPRLKPWDRMAKSTTVVAKAYSHALRHGPPLVARTSWVRFMLSPRLKAFTPSDSVKPDGEIHGVPCPPTAEVLALSDMDRRALFLDVLHDNLYILARKRHWPIVPLDLARKTVIDEGYRFQFSAQKKSPSRKHVALLHFEIDGNGDAWLDLTVTDSSDQIIYRSPAWLTDASYGAWLASKRTFKWQDQSVIVESWPKGPPFDEGSRVHVQQIPTGE